MLPVKDTQLTASARDSGNYTFLKQFRFPLSPKTLSSRAGKAAISITLQMSNKHSIWRCLCKLSTFPLCHTSETNQSSSLSNWIQYLNHNVLSEDSTLYTKFSAGFRNWLKMMKEREGGKEGGRKKGRKEKEGKGRKEREGRKEWRKGGRKEKKENSTKSLDNSHDLKLKTYFKG